MRKIHRLHWTGNKGKRKRAQLRETGSLYFPSAFFFFGRYMNFMFDLEDASDDGAIDAAEFAIVCSSYGLDKAECEDAFRKMSQVESAHELISIKELFFNLCKSLRTGS